MAEDKNNNPTEDNPEDLPDQSMIDEFIEENESKSAETAEESGTSVESEDEGDLDQAEIDALFSGGESENEETETPSAEAEEEEELDQAGIDALLGGDAEEEDTEEEIVSAVEAGGEESAAEPEEESEEKTVDDLNQDSIDALFAESGPADGENGSDSPELSKDEGDESDEGEVDQSAIDALFTEGESDREEEGEEADTVEGGGVDEEDEEAPEALEGEEDDNLDELFASLEEEEEKSFLGEDFSFAEEIDSDADGGEIVDLEEDEVEKEGVKPKEAGAAGAERDEDDPPEKKKEWINFAGIPPYLKNRKVMAGLGGSLAVIVAFCIYFFPGNDGEVKERQIQITKSESVNVTETGAKKAGEGEEKDKNFIPVAKNAEYVMDRDGGNVEIVLQAFDRDDDNLNFVITESPGYGRLSGSPPAFTYLPNADFSGEDSFRFKVGDGKSYSEEAAVMIIGPDLTRLADHSKKEEKTVKAEKEGQLEKTPRSKILDGKQPVPRASNLTVTTKNTESLILDFASHWEEKNKSSYDRTVYCKIDTSGLRGKVEEIGPAVYRYRADPFFSGIEIINYRFKKNGISSSPGRITIMVTPGDSPPEAKIAKMNRREYTVGETVIIDASPSRDDKRHALTFEWEQVAGVPVRLREENEEGSRISFIMPSDFSNRRNSGPLLKVTVIDDRGQKDEELIKTRSVSLRESALWRKKDGN